MVDNRRTKFPVLIFTGMTGVGKTTLAELLTRRFKLRKVDVYDSVVGIIGEIGRPILTPKELRRAYEIFCKELVKQDFDIVEVANDWPDEIIPRLVEIIKAKGKENIVLIFCTAHEKIILERIKKRARPIPEYLIKEQGLYNAGYFSDLCLKLGMGFVKINTGKKTEKCRTQLVRELKRLKYD